jgi:hypothetical protein
MLPAVLQSKGFQAKLSQHMLHDSQATAVVYYMTTC